MQENKSSSITTIFNGLNIHAKKWGKNDSFPIFAFHGWQDNAGTFDRLAPLITESKYQVIAFDLPGHGHSDHFPKGMVYQFSDYVSAIYEICENINEKEVILLGHSLGGSASSFYASLFPERVKKLICIDSLGSRPAFDHEIPGLLKNHIKERSLNPYKKSRFFKTKDEVIQIRKKIGNLSTDAANCLVERALIQTSEGYTWRTDPSIRITSPYRNNETQNLAFLEKLSVPTLVINAKDGYQSKRDFAQKRIDTVKNIIVETVEGDHHVHLNQPENVAPVILNYLKQ